jgi:hypothetical protein
MATQKTNGTIVGDAKKAIMTLALLVPEGSIAYS